MDLFGEKKTADVEPHIIFCGRTIDSNDATTQSSFFLFQNDNSLFPEIFATETANSTRTSPSGEMSTPARLLSATRMALASVLLWLPFSFSLSSDRVLSRFSTSLAEVPPSLLRIKPHSWRNIAVWNNQHTEYNTIAQKSKRMSERNTFFFGSDDLVTPQIGVIDGNNLHTDNLNCK